MTKYITVKLTEDQANYLSQTLMIQGFGLERNAERSPNKEFYDSQLAFNRRIRSKLAQAKANAKS